MRRSAYDATTLRSDWKTLIEEYPGRFYVGIDDMASWNESEGRARGAQRTAGEPDAFDGR